MAHLRSHGADDLYDLRNAGEHPSAVLHAFGVRMIGNSSCKGGKSTQTSARSKRLTLAAWLAERPWGLACASFAVTALLIRPDYVGVI